MYVFFRKHVHVFPERGTCFFTGVISSERIVPRDFPDTSPIAFFLHKTGEKQRRSLRFLAKLCFQSSVVCSSKVTSKVSLRELTILYINRLSPHHLSKKLLPVYIGIRSAKVPPIFEDTENPQLITLKF